MGKRKPCAGLWNTPTVHVSGIVTTCCLDTELKNSLGNLKEKSLKEMWFGEKIHRWRIAQIRGRFSESGPMCTECNYMSAGIYPWEKVIEYLKERGEERILKEIKEDAEE